MESADSPVAVVPKAGVSAAPLTIDSMPLPLKGGMTRSPSHGGSAHRFAPPPLAPPRTPDYKKGRYQVDRVSQCLTDPGKRKAYVPRTGGRNSRLPLPPLSPNLADDSDLPNHGRSHSRGRHNNRIHGNRHSMPNEFPSAPFTTADAEPKTPRGGSRRSASEHLRATKSVQSTPNLSSSIHSVGNFLKRMSGMKRQDSVNSEFSDADDASFASETGEVALEGRISKQGSLSRLVSPMSSKKKLNLANLHAGGSPPDRDSSPAPRRSVHRRQEISGLPPPDPSTPRRMSSRPYV